MSSQSTLQEEKILYWNMGSQPGRAVKALVDIGKIKCKLVSIDMMSRQQKSKQYLEKYPLGKIPFFTKGSNIKIGQSNAIMVYLYQTQPSIPRHYYGQTPEKRAHINQYLSWYQAFFRQKMFKPVLLFMNSAVMGKPMHQNQKTQSMSQVHEALKALDSLLKLEWQKSQGKGKFVCGGQKATIADLLIFFQATNVVLFGIDINQYSFVKKWYKNVYNIDQVKTITHQWYSIGKQINQMFSSIEVIKSKL